jgi:hypothetical protein
MWLASRTSKARARRDANRSAATRTVLPTRWNAGGARDVSLAADGDPAPLGSQVVGKAAPRQPVAWHSGAVLGARQQSLELIAKYAIAFA